MNAVWSVWCVLLLTYATESARILGFFPTTGRSHLIIEMAVIKTLVDRGHDVTVATSLNLYDKNPKYRHIKFEEATVPDDLFRNAIESQTIWSLMKSAGAGVTYGIEQAIGILNDPRFKEMLKTDTYDLVVMGYFLNDFHLGVPAHFKCPVVLVDTNLALPHLYSWIGNPLEIFSAHSPVTGGGKLTFLNRLLNFGVYTGFAVYSIFYEKQMRSVYDKYFPPNLYPSFDEMTKNVSLVFHISHLSEGIIRPYVPAYIQIGGIQVKPKPDPLPQDIENHIQNAGKHGAILFSIGTHAKIDDLCPGKLQIILKVLSSLKQNVIFKWENTNYPTNYSNILFRNWLPQDDLLPHPNVRLFISHCALGSYAEAQYHGIPLVCLPLFGDQFGISDSVQEKGYGIRLNYHELSELAFENAILEVLKNPKYRNAIKQFSNLYQDRPMSAQDTAAYWMEYVIRHRGAKHLQSPAVHMSTIAYYGFDVIAFLLAVIYVTFKVCQFVWRKTFGALCRKFCSKDKSVSKKKKTH